MCGIFCVKSKKENRIDLVKKSLNIINHRGPDESNYINFDKIILGHNRLKINDCDREKIHPFVFNEVVMLVNGEIYGYEEEKSMLEKDGVVFKTNCDSEVILHLYLKYGINFLSYIDGEFSIVIYDKREKLFYCIRDRMGSKPLNVYNKGDLIISSEIKAILPWLKKTEIDKESLYFSTHLQYLPLNKTLIKDIFTIKPGHYITIKEDLVVEERCYWSLKNVKEQKISKEEINAITKDLVEGSVKKKIPKEVKWCTHLSGGLDSSLINLLAKEYGGNIDCFGIGFKNGKVYYESQIAKGFAEANGLNLNLIMLDNSDILNLLPLSIYAGEGLCINGHISAKYALNKEIKKNGYKVSLSGEGSDEIFMGYSHLKNDYCEAVSDLENGYLGGVQLKDGETLDLSVLRSKGFIPSWIEAKSSIGFKLSNLFSNDLIYRSCYKNPYSDIDKDILGYSSNLKASSGSWFNYCLSGYILKTLDDGQAMANSIESRLCYLDKDLIEFCYSLDDSNFFKNGVEKVVLKDAFSDILPESLKEKTKQSFMSPPLFNFNDKLIMKSLNEFIFENEKFKELDFFDVEKIKEHVLKSKESVSGLNYDPVFFYLLSLGIFVNFFTK